MKFIKDHLLPKARSRQHFYEMLIDNGLFLTYHKGIPNGIMDTDGRAYSWKKLGIEPAHLMALDQKERLYSIDERLKKLEHLRSGQQPEQSIEP
ncbi:MAG: hypothetical protein RLP14_08290 [Owenweeksia sp.]